MQNIVKMHCQKKISNLYFSNNFLHIFSQTNVFIGFYNKKGIKLFETCI
jgi:hypothetical protein